MTVDLWTRSGVRCWVPRAEASRLDFCPLELHSLMQKTEIKKIIICNSDKQMSQVLLSGEKAED